jgi:hypothetical protein
LGVRSAAGAVVKFPSCYPKGDGDEPGDDSLQAELDHEAERIDRIIQDSLDNPPENDDTSG